MKQQELIDKSVEYLKGVWLDETGEENHLYRFYSGRFVTGVYFIPTTSEYVCTKEQFITRAKELGWVSGFKWGVEYPTNGKQPELAGDVLCNTVHQDGERLEYNDHTVKDWDWPELKAFYIIDPRYKPKDPEPQTKNTKDLSDVIFAVSDAISVAVDAGAMPAARDLQKINRDLLAKDSVVGIGQYELQTKPDSSWKRGLPVEFPSGFGVLIVPEQDANGVVIVMAEGGEYRRVAADVINPIKSEREEFIETAMKVVRLADHNNYLAGCLGELYDAGFKAPDEKIRS